MKVILYSTGCPKCNVLNAKLNSKNIEFEVINDMDIMLEKGFMQAPMLEVDEKVMDFSAAIKWINGME